MRKRQTKCTFSSECPAGHYHHIIRVAGLEVNLHNLLQTMLSDIT